MTQKKVIVGLLLLIMSFLTVALEQSLDIHADLVRYSKMRADQRGVDVRDLKHDTRVTEEETRQLRSAAYEKPTAVNEVLVVPNRNTLTPLQKLNRAKLLHDVKQQEYKADTTVADDVLKRLNIVRWLHGKALEKKYSTTQ